MRVRFPAAPSDPALTLARRSASAGACLRSLHVCQAGRGRGRRRRDRRLLRARARSSRCPHRAVRARAGARVGLLGRKRRAHLPQPLHPDRQPGLAAQRSALDVDAGQPVLPAPAAGGAAVAGPVRARGPAFGGRRAGHPGALDRQPRAARRARRGARDELRADRNAERVRVARRPRGRGACRRPLRAPVRGVRRRRDPRARAGAGRADGRIGALSDRGPRRPEAVRRDGRGSRRRGGCRDPHRHGGTLPRRARRRHGDRRGRCLVEAARPAAARGRQGLPRRLRAVGGGPADPGLGTGDLDDRDAAAGPTAALRDARAGRSRPVRRATSRGEDPRGRRALVPPASQPDRAGGLGGAPAVPSRRAPRDRAARFRRGCHRPRDEGRLARAGHRAAGRASSSPARSPTTSSHRSTPDGSR